jgi:hypothetical protein
MTTITDLTNLNEITTHADKPAKVGRKQHGGLKPAATLLKITGESLIVIILCRFLHFIELDK